MVATTSETAYKLSIGGEWRGADSGKTFEVLNPATLEPVATVPDAGAAETQRAIDAAHAVQKSWEATTAYERATILWAAARLMRERADQLGRVLTLEQGKPLAESKGEIGYAASFLEWFAEEGKRVYGSTVPASVPTKRILVLKRPVGVTAAITPWNFPSAMVTRKLAPALAAGCTIILKPAELTPLSALEVAKIFDEVGLPKGVLSVVVGSNPAETAAPFMRDTRVRKISFTGSTEVGKLLMEQAAPTVKRLSLELGGHAPLIVFDDADLDEAADQAVLSKMRCMGESCLAVNRIFVQRGIKDAFAQKLVERMKSYRVGNGLESGTTVGPLIDEATFEKVQSHVDDARGKGATVALGGNRADAGNGYFFEPTVLLDVDSSMLISHEETFGPVAGVLTFDTEDEVIERANDTHYGLASYCFTRDIARAWRLAEQLDYGLVGMNDAVPSAAQAPFGGMKESGFGREGGAWGIEEFLDVKYISLGGMR